MFLIKDKGISYEEQRFNKAKERVLKATAQLIELRKLEEAERKENKINRIDFYGLRIFDEDCERVQCCFSYIRNGRQSSFAFPLSIGLKESCLQKDKQQEAAQTYTLPINKRSRDYNELLIAALYHPITTLVVGIAGAVNLLSVAGVSMAASPVLTSILGIIGPLAGAGMLGISIAYFVPPLIYKLAKTKLRKNLSGIFQSSLDDIDNDKSEEALVKIKSLRLIYKVMLYQYFPGNLDLKWCYNYLQARISYREHLVEDAFELSETSDQLFIVLRMFLNKSNEQRKGMLRDKILPSMIGDHQRCKEIFEKHEKSFSKYLKRYINLIPINSQQHQELAVEMKRHLMSCFNSLSNGCIEEACNKFIAIPWDGYCKVAYPAAATLYYELKAVVVLASQGLKMKLNLEWDTEERMDFARMSLEKTKKIIDEFYSEQSEGYQRYFKSFKDFNFEMMEAFKRVKPGRPIIPLAEMQRAERIITLTDHPLGDTRVLRIVNRLYHIGSL